MTKIRTTQTSIFDYSIKQGIACIYARSSAFLMGTDLKEKQRLEVLFRDLESADEIKAVLLFNAVDAFTADKHRQYVQSLTRLKKKDSYGSATKLLAREENALDQYALLAVGYKKLLVSCLVGEIATPFFGLSLTSDIRLAKQDMYFSLSHVDIGIPPVGGLGFLLPKYVGQGRAAELLLFGGTIDAEVSYQMGLVNKVFPDEGFEENCIAWVSNMLDSKSLHISYTRQLLYNDCPSFEAYLLKESIVRLRAFYSHHIDV